MFPENHLSKVSKARGGGVGYSVCVVIPAYKVRKQIVSVIQSVGPEVDKILVIDDYCPEKTGHLVKQLITDPRVEVIFLPANKGVGGAVIAGYERAMELGIDIVVKVDGDGQMNLADLKSLICPIIKGEADYTKGNRFYNLEGIASMPKMRIVGNLVLSFLSKFSTGYWNIFDPNNGFTAITAPVLKTLPLHKIEKRYFFESDLLFRLYLSRAKVVDVPLEARYGEEKSNLKISKSLYEFSFKHFRNTLKRISYIYFIQDFSLASIELPAGLVLAIFGLTTGISSWLSSMRTGIATNTGTQILVSITLLSSLQLILSFANFDSRNYPIESRFQLENLKNEEN